LLEVAWGSPLRSWQPSTSCRHADGSIRLPLVIFRVPTLSLLKPCRTFEQTSREVSEDSESQANPQVPMKYP
jgi:hypothetical protein